MGAEMADREMMDRINLFVLCIKTDERDARSNYTVSKDQELVNME